MKIKSLVKTLVGVGLVFHLTACGTLLYPERKGQTGGKIDAGVAAMNGVGLLLFVVPGLVAFAVDFYNGTIYLPNSASNGEQDGTLYTIKGNGPLTVEQAQQLIAEHTGKDVDLGKAEHKALKGMNEQAIAMHLQQAQPVSN
ncbi:MAG: hypothetical protein ACQEQ8_07220 [Pseudomonadota bacterium]